MAAHQDAAAKFSEVVALIQRNERGERDARDAEQDLRRVLLMARDAKLRDQLVQFQAVRRITTIWSASKAIVTQRYCAGPDFELQHVSAAALLAFSIQNECQIQIDSISGIPTLLRLLGSKDGDLCIYSAATMWNLCKSPLLMLKLERGLTDLLVTPLEPFHLAAHPTGERGVPGVIESDSPANLNLLISCSISTQLSIVLRVENYTGHTRSLADQFRFMETKVSSNKHRAQQDKSVAHFDESGVLIARTCAVCSKAIKVTRKSARGTFLLCAKDECGQTYHVKCSRWARLDEDDIHPEHFHCDLCMLLLPLYYWDFIAESEQHEELLSENLFKSVAITRVVPSSSTSTSAQSHMATFETDGGGDTPPLPLAMLFNRKQELIGVGVKRFRVPRSSKDDEMFIVTIKFTAVTAYPAAHQVVKVALSSISTSNSSNKDTDADDTSSATDLDCGWQVSYASEDAEDVEFKPGNAMFWPATFLLDVAPLLYTDRSLEELECAWVYEFTGEQLVDKMFSFGARAPANTSDGNTNSNNTDKLRGLWTSLHPRKGVCMKVLAEQIGRAKQLCDTQPGGGDRSALMTAKPTSVAGSHRKKRAKPHFLGKKLNKVVVTTT